MIPPSSSEHHPHLQSPSEADLARVIQGVQPRQAELYLAMHRLVLQAIPGIRYSVDCVDAAIGYGAHQFGYDGWGLGALTPYRAWVSLGFVRGALLGDPEGLLEGTGRLVRHVKVLDSSELETKRVNIQRMLRQASELMAG